MKTKKTLLCIAAMVMIIPFFLLLTFVLQKNSYDGDLVENYHEILTVQVNGGQTDPESHSFQITFPEDGYYNYYMTWDVTDPGYNTALVVKDPNGEVVTLLTAYQTRELPNMISTVAGAHTFELIFLDDENAYRDFAKNYYHYEDGSAEMESFLGAYDFSTPITDGSRVTDITFRVNYATAAPIYLPIAATLIGALILIILFLCLSKEPEEGVTLRERFDEMGNRHAIFMFVVWLTQLTCVIFIRAFSYLFVGADSITISLILTILSVDAIGFPLTYLACKGVPTQPIPQKKMGVGKFLLFIVMCFGIVLPLSYLGAIIHNMITLPFGGAQTTLAIVMMNSNMFWRVLALGIGAPIFEELVFRKLLVDRLIKYGEFTAILTSALLFGLFHNNFSQVFYAIGLGALFAFVYARTGRIRYSIGLHMAINMTTSVITVVLANKYAQYAPANPKDPVALQQAMEASNEAAFYISAYSMWNIIFVLLAIVGAILLIVFLAKKQFRLKRFEGELTRGEVVKALFTSKFIWLYLIGIIGMYLYTYLPVMLF